LLFLAGAFVSVSLLQLLQSVLMALALRIILEKDTKVVARAGTSTFREEAGVRTLKAASPE